MKNLTNQLKSAEAQIIIQEEIIDNEKYSSNRKVLSMQSQVNFLLNKDCQKEFNKTAKISNKRLSCIVESKENTTAVHKQKKKIENARKSTAKWYCFFDCFDYNDCTKIIYKKYYRYLEGDWVQSSQP